MSKAAAPCTVPATRSPNGPHIVGYQAAGTVLAMGGQVTRFQPGERVVTVGLAGSHAELRAVPEPFCWPIPVGLSTAEAACVPAAFGTAHDALFEFGRLQPGERVLVHAGAGGVGIAATQLASRTGARVLATVSGDGKLARLAELGLGHAINCCRRRGPQSPGHPRRRDPGGPCRGRARPIRPARMKHHRPTSGVADAP